VVDPSSLFKTKGTTADTSTVAKKDESQGPKTKSLRVHRERIQPAQPSPLMKVSDVLKSVLGKTIFSDRRCFSIKRMNNICITYDKHTYLRSYIINQHCNGCTTESFYFENVFKRNFWKKIRCNFFECVYVLSDVFNLI